MPKLLWRRRSCYITSLAAAVSVFIIWLIVTYMFAFDEDDFPDNSIYDIFVEEQGRRQEVFPLDEEIAEEMRRNERDAKNRQKQDSADPPTDPTDPIILWWTYFTGEPGASRQCGHNRCFFTNDRRYQRHRNTKVFMFYGTDLTPHDLPLPRSTSQLWALLHEESPKNNYILCHEAALSLFNYTSTFRRESDFPISTQHLQSLQWLSQMTYVKTVQEKNTLDLSPVVYVQSDCDPPSHRDDLVAQLMKYVKVDSYGACLNNKQLPAALSEPLEGMAHADFYSLLSGYKFALALENAVCDDYMTEKLWRPLMLGVVPVVFGSSKVRDFLPSNKSAVLVQDFTSAKDLASFINNLNNNDSEYQAYLSWKKSGITNRYLKDIMTSRNWAPDDESSWTPGSVNFVEGFECFVCNKVHDNMDRERRGEPMLHKSANLSHFDCPRPAKFDKKGRYGKETSWRENWGNQWDEGAVMAREMAECVLAGNDHCGENDMMGRLKPDF